MKVRVPDKWTVLVDWDGQDNYKNMIDPILLLRAHEMGLTVTPGERVSYQILPDGRADLTQYIYEDVWVSGPDEEVALFKLKYL